MEIQCRQCDAALDVERLDLERSIAECTVCGHLSEISDQLPAARRRRALARTRPPLPAGFELQRIPRAEVIDDGAFRSSRLEQRDDLVLSWPWRRNRGPGSAAVMMVALIESVLSAIFYAGTPLMWFGFAVAALTAIYLATYAIVQRTRLTITANRLELRNGPLPDPRPALRLQVDDLRQLVVARRTPDHFDPALHALTAIDADGRRRRLVTFESVDEAELVEHAIEDLLGIVDAPEAGEASRALPAGDD